MEAKKKEAAADAPKHPPKIDIRQNRIWCFSLLTPSSFPAPIRIDPTFAGRRCTSLSSLFTWRGGGVACSIAADAAGGGDGGGGRRRWPAAKAAAVGDDAAASESGGNWIDSQGRRGWRPRAVRAAVGWRGGAWRLGGGGTAYAGGRWLGVTAGSRGEGKPAGASADRRIRLRLPPPTAASASACVRRPPTPARPLPPTPAPARPPPPAPAPTRPPPSPVGPPCLVEERRGVEERRSVEKGEVEERN